MTPGDLLVPVLEPHRGDYVSLKLRDGSEAYGRLWRVSFDLAYLINPSLTEKNGMRTRVVRLRDVMSVEYPDLTAPQPADAINPSNGDISLS